MTEELVSMTGKLKDYFNPDDAFSQFESKPKYPPQVYWLLEDAVKAYIMDLKLRGRANLLVAKLNTKITSVETIGELL